MAARRFLLRRARTAATLGPRRYLLVAEAAGALLVARLRLWRQPFRVVARTMGRLVSPSAVPDHRPLPAPDAAAARDIGWAVRTVARIVPFRAVCLEQAIAAQAMLRRRGIASVMRLGVEDGGEASLSAHAWLIAGETRITGYPVAATLTPVGCFVCEGTRRPAS